MRRHLLVFHDESRNGINLRAFVDALDPKAKMYTLDGHMCFIESDLSVAQVSDQFLKFAGSSLFFVTDVTNSAYSGRMPESFWDHFKRPELSAAAE